MFLKRITVLMILITSFNAYANNCPLVSEVNLQRADKVDAFYYESKDKAWKSDFKNTSAQHVETFHSVAFTANKEYTANSTDTLTLKGTVNMCVYKDVAGKIVTLKPATTHTSSISNNKNWLKASNGNTYTCKISETDCNFE